MGLKRVIENMIQISAKIERSFFRAQRSKTMDDQRLRGSTQIEAKALIAPSPLLLPHSV
jgi:hypothetical protein